MPIISLRFLSVTAQSSVEDAYHFIYKHTYSSPAASRVNLSFRHGYKIFVLAPTFSSTYHAQDLLFLALLENFFCYFDLPTADLILALSITSPSQQLCSAIEHLLPLAICQPHLALSIPQGSRIEASRIFFAVAIHPSKVKHGWTRAFKTGENCCCCC